jgi:prevent-host-death family protein
LLAIVMAQSPRQRSASDLPIRTDIAYTIGQNIVRKGGRVMKTVTATEAKNRLGALISDVASGSGAVTIEHHGRPRVVLVSTEEWAEICAMKEKWLREEAWAEIRSLAAEARERNANLSEDEADAIVDELTDEAKRRIAQRLVQQ